MSRAARADLPEREDCDVRGCGRCVGCGDNDDNEIRPGWSAPASVPFSPFSCPAFGFPKANANKVPNTAVYAKNTKGPNIIGAFNATWVPRGCNPCEAKFATSELYRSELYGAATNCPYAFNGSISTSTSAPPPS